MDLGLNNRTALICASSRGLGKACAAALAREGCRVVINGRSVDALAGTAEELTRQGFTVTAVAADINTEAGRQLLLQACPAPDILVNNNAGPPPGDFQQWTEADWLQAVQSNMLAPIFMIKAVIEGMQALQFGRIINVTSAMVKSPHPMMGLSTAARSGLTAFAKGLSKAVAKDNVTINNLLPERFDTDRQKHMAGLMVKQRGISLAEARREITSTIAANRFGEPTEFGDACAYLCSAQAGYISGQNLQLDGGSYDGLI